MMNLPSKESKKNAVRCCDSSHHLHLWPKINRTDEEGTKAIKTPDYILVWFVKGKFIIVIMKLFLVDVKLHMQWMDIATIENEEDKTDIM